MNEENLTAIEPGREVIVMQLGGGSQFLEKAEITRLLKKYCRFLPVEVAFGKKTEWKDGKEVDLEEDNVVNETNPLWTRKPTELKDEDYSKFYRSLYPMSEDPIFNIHLNVDSVGDSRGRSFTTCQRDSSPA